MNLESARKFAARHEQLETDLDDYRPRRTEYDRLSPRERFNGLWERFDELAAQAPRYDGLDRSSFIFEDDTGVGVTVQRSIGEMKRGLRQDYQPRTITATWQTEGEVLHIESVSHDTGLIDSHSDDFGKMEETEEAIRSMLEQHKAMLAFISRQPNREDHW